MRRDKVLGVPFSKRIQFKITISIVVLIILIVTITSGIFYQKSYTMVLDTIRNDALLIADQVGDDVNIDALNVLQTEGDMTHESFTELGDYLDHIMKLSGVKYLYIMRQNDAGEFTYIIEGADYNSEDPTSIGDVEDNIYEGYTLAFEGKSSQDDDITFDDDGFLLSAYAPIKEGNKVIAIVGVDYDATDEYKEFQSFRNMIIIIGLLTIFMGVVMSMFISSAISKGIVKLAISSQRVSEGDFSIETIQSKSSSELGYLTNAFNHMIENIHTLIFKIKDTVEVLEKTSGTLSGSTTELSETSQQVATAISELAHGADSQAREAVESTASVAELSLALNELIDKLTSTIESALIMKNHNKAGLETIDSLNKAVNKDTEMRSEVSEVIKTLSLKSKSIGDIVATIDAIAEQTNLLALNAAIEAARAGEHGRGFAVVAEEVRKLAEESSKSTGYIRSTIDEITSIIDQVDVSMDKSNSLSKVSVTQMEDTQQVFNETSKSISYVVEMLDSMQSNVEVIRSTEEVVSKSMESITAIAEEASAATQEIYASTEEQASYIENVTHSTHDLNNLIVNLSKAIEHYEV
ncbi:MAG: methyl-accepting chemotaxis protein [Clostridiales bacterium]|nr:methyl-accepting chemotaxis protein [Clostridiales bacterium]